MPRPRTLSRLTSGAGSWLLRFLSPTDTPKWSSSAFVSSLVGCRDRYGEFPERFLRCVVFESAYEGTIYKSIHEFSKQLKINDDLYEYIRSIFAPTKQIPDFWASHMYPGTLDKNAGDGKTTPSAIPILTENEAIRPVLAMILDDSRWQVNKNIFPLKGEICGDAYLAGVDDEIRGRVYLRNVDPKTVYNLKKDPFGNAKGYTLVEARPDPRPEEESAGVFGSKPWVTYVEVCSRDGEDVVYRSYLYTNGSPITYRPNNEEPTYEWRQDSNGDPVESDTPGEWRESYGFVPFYHVPVRDIGKGFGRSCYQGSWDKLKEIDDIGSKFHDHIRRAIENQLFMTGVTDEEMERFVSGDGGIDSREDNGVFKVVNADAKIQSMSGDVNIAAVSAHLDAYKQVIRDDFPEIAAEDVSSTASGESRRVAQERIESEVVQHRAPYDAVLITALQGLVSIGIRKGYRGFEGLIADAYHSTDPKVNLSFSIGERPVFSLSDDDRLDLATKRATIIKILTDAGIPIEQACQIAELSPDVITAIITNNAKAIIDAETILRAQNATIVAEDETSSVDDNPNKEDES